jgi:hypothetical protein
MVDVFKLRSSLIGQRKLVAFLGGRSTVLMCLSNTLLIWLKIGPTKDKKATNVQSCVGEFLFQILQM